MQPCWKSLVPAHILSSIPCFAVTFILAFKQEAWLLNSQKTIPHVEQGNEIIAYNVKLTWSLKTNILFENRKRKLFEILEHLLHH